MTTYLGKSCSFSLPRVPYVNCRQFMYLVISLLVLRAGYGIWLYQLLIIAYLFTFKDIFFFNLQQMNEVTRHFCWHQNFVPWGLSAPALGLYTCIKSSKKCIKSDFEEIFLKLATNDRSDKMFLLTSKFRPQGVVSPCPGAIYMYKIMKKIV